MYLQDLCGEAEKLSHSHHVPVILEVNLESAETDSPNVEYLVGIYLEI